MEALRGKVCGRGQRFGERETAFVYEERGYMVQGEAVSCFYRRAGDVAAAVLCRESVSVTRVCVGVE